MHWRDVAERIKARQKDHVTILAAVLRADERAIYPADLIVSGAIQRSLMLGKGFLSMLRSGNFLCAGALLRLQLDNILRLYASSLFPSGSDTLMAFLEETPLSRLKAPDGKSLTDRELVNRVSQIYPWIPSVYKRTSGYVHYSLPAVMSTITKISNGGKIHGSVGLRRGRRWNAESRLEAAQAFDEATKSVLEMVHSWGHTKASVAADRNR